MRDECFGKRVYERVATEGHPYKSESGRVMQTCLVTSCAKTNSDLPGMLSTAAHVGAGLVREKF